MTLKDNSIITLSNNRKYIILKSINYMDAMYYLAMLLDDDDNVILGTPIILQLEFGDDEIFASFIKNRELIKKIVKTI